MRADEAALTLCALLAGIGVVHLNDDFGIFEIPFRMNESAAHSAQYWFGWAVAKACVIERSGLHIGDTVTKYSEVPP